MASIHNLLKLYEDMENKLIEDMTKRLLYHSKHFTSKDTAAWLEYQEKQRLLFKRSANNTINRYKRIIRRETEKTLREVYSESKQKEFKRLVRNYGKTSRFKDALSDIDLQGLHGLDEARLVSILSAADRDIENATRAVLRLVDDEYRRVIVDASLEYNAGLKTLNKAIDDAQRNFLIRGITSITYSNGAKVNIRSYSEMALRTSGQRARIEAEASLRDYLGIYTVRVSYHGITCDKCAPWQGKVLIDDVYQHGTPDGKHKLLSEAINAGLLHPNCRHSLMTIDPEIDGDSIEYEYTEIDADHYKEQQHQRKLERDIRKYKRLEAGTSDPSEQKTYKELRKLKSKELKDFVEDSDFLVRQRDREKI